LETDIQSLITNHPQLFLVSTFNTFNISALVGLLAILALLVISALMSASEVAFFSMSPTQLEKLRNAHSHKAHLILQLLGIPKHLLATLLIANNLVNVGIVIISTFVTGIVFNFSEYPLFGFIFQVVIITSLILLFGEIMPKIYATNNGIKFAAGISGPMIILVKLLKPLSNLMVGSTNMIDRRLATRYSGISLGDISEAIDIATDDKNQNEETRMLKGIVKFGNIGVSEIMKPRVDVVFGDRKMPYDTLLKLIIDSGYSRIPVYSVTPDSVSGILYIKDLLPHLNKGPEFAWQNLLRQAYFVPENKKIDDLLLEFQERKIHMAIVVDEYGGTSGIVTLEDVIEEIVGEIDDEFDTESDQIPFQKIDDNTYLFEGKTLLNDFCRITGTDSNIFENIRGEADTLAGLILEIEGRLPLKNEIIVFDNFEFRIESADKKRIKSVKTTIRGN
jgi:gliding motility-associated protein GldE